MVMSRNGAACQRTMGVVRSQLVEPLEQVLAAGDAGVSCIVMRAADRLCDMRMMTIPWHDGNHSLVSRAHHDDVSCPPPPRQTAHHRASTAHGSWRLKWKLPMH